ncbi:tripartite motif-containing protein 5-like [Symsagittifera roscoffensis]|uniref:tripartite motif-containing protein 5-like n=1 Tax=Symsagittifera roscoffensis TaxID=84072 RepID=UPI00307C2867
MATGGDQFECPICLETLMNPRILSSCGHSYCSSPKNCLKGIIQSYSRQCPECRTPIEDRVRNEKHCVENFTLKSAIASRDVPARSQTSEADKKMCRTHKKAKKYFCQNSSCEISICKDCWRASHGAHLVVLQEDIDLKQATEKTEKALQLFEGCQNTIRQLTDQIIDLNAEILTVTDKSNALMSRKPDIKRVQDLQQVTKLEESIKIELIDLKAKNSAEITKMNTMIVSCKVIDKSIEAAIQALNAKNSSTIANKNNTLRSAPGKPQSPVKYSVELGCQHTYNDVFITLFGQNGNTGRQKLGKMHKNMFIENKFELQLIDVGRMERLVVEIEFGEGGETQWDLEYFVVTNLSSGEEAVFFSDYYLQKNQDGSPTTLELLAKIF